MAKARREVELAVRTNNQPGMMGQVMAAVSGAGVNILAYCTYSDRDEAVILLVPEDPLSAKACLERAGFVCKANPVVVVGATDRVGAAAHFGAHLGKAGIDIIYSYASSAGHGQFIAVFKTTNDEHAISILDAAPCACAARAA